jgi:hypothetical protein
MMQHHVLTYYKTYNVKRDYFSYMSLVNYTAGAYLPRSPELHVGDPQACDQNEGIDERPGKAEEQ